MDEIFKVFDNLIQIADKNSRDSKIESNNWRFCVALAHRGWKAISCEKVKKQDCEDIIIRWKKDGYDDVYITLTFKEQCLWLEYLEKNKKAEK
jgi:hypothetical protein